MEQRLEWNLKEVNVQGVGSGRASERASGGQGTARDEVFNHVQQGREGNRCGGQRLREEASPLESQRSSDAGKVGRLLAKRSADTSFSRRPSSTHVFPPWRPRHGRAHALSPRPSLATPTAASHSDEDKRLNLILLGGF